MSENTIFIKKYCKDNVIAVNENEIWRYAGYGGKACDISEELKAKLYTVEEALRDKLSYKVCYRRMSIAWEKDMPVLPFSSSSKALAKLLAGCDEIIIFCASIGLEVDRYIAKYQKLSPIMALLTNAYGTERIEAVCESFCEDMAQQLSSEELFLTKRFSAGYGDLPLEAQTDFFRLLDCSRQIGVSLNESLLMSPSKSVTAIMGIKKDICNTSTHKCEACSNKECEFRRQDT